MSNDADRSVGTAAIRAALTGKEAVVLDALGVPWEQGKPHITLSEQGPHRQYSIVALGRAEKTRILHLRLSVDFRCPDEGRGD